MELKSENNDYDALEVIRLLMGIFVTLLVVWLAVNLIFPSESKKVGSEQSPIVFILNTFSFQVITIVFTAFFLKRNNFRAGEIFGLGRSSPLKVFLTGLIGFIVFVPLGLELQRVTIMLINTLLGKSASYEPQVVVQILQQKPPMFYTILIGISTIILAPIAEEILFRGLLYTSLKTAGHPLIAIYGVSFLFGVIHNNLVAALPLAFFGVILTVIYEITGNLFAPIIAHSLFNLMNFIILMYNLNPENVVK
ncbi:MAG: CPBP family intramembrane glutamic endopeptidase [Verrucomicrobiia bacterium]